MWPPSRVVGVTSLVKAHYYPTAGMYLVYAVFVLIGFVVWRRASRISARTSELEGAAA